jgi:hypothetical protein
MVQPFKHPQEDREIIEEMADVIVALTRQQGGCSRIDLIKAGFAAHQIGSFYALASAMAALLLKRRPRNH